MDDIADQLAAFFDNMFTREAFAAGLLERSFRQPLGWIELAVAFSVAAAAYMAAGVLVKKGVLDRVRWQPLRYVLRRIMWPGCILAAGVVALGAWKLAGMQAVWLRLLVLAAYWMIAFRTILAVLHQALPRHNISDWLEKTAANVGWVAFVLWLSGIDSIIVRWMKSLQLPVGSSKLNLYTVVTGLVWVGVVMVLMMWLAKWVNGWLMGSTRLDINLRIVLSKVVKTALMVLSVLIALPLVGIDLTVLSVFGGALGVGLGFGLQKIASNYVSGFIILADRSIRPNDRLTVNGFTGYVTEITSRYVVLKSSNGQEALIPNETFVTSTVINESYTGRALSQSLNIQVAYHTDLALALNILKEAAAAQERVAAEPPPSAYLVGFGDNGIDLRVAFWVKDPENGFLGLFSAILLTIWRRFNEEHIEFPYPQREIRILKDDPEPDTAALIKARFKAQEDTRSDEALEEGNG